MVSRLLQLAVLAALTGCAITPAESPPSASLSASPGAKRPHSCADRAPSRRGNRVQGLGLRPYSSREPARSLRPGAPGHARLPLLIWHSGSGWDANDVKDFGGDEATVNEFTARGYAVASISIRSSSDARFPAQGFDVRAAIRYLRENAAPYGIDPGRFRLHGRFVRRVGDRLRSHHKRHPQARWRDWRRRHLQCRSGGSGLLPADRLPLDRQVRRSEQPANGRGDIPERFAHVTRGPPHSVPGRRPQRRPT